jgi:hypothetical protein
MTLAMLGAAPEEHARENVDKLFYLLCSNVC